jgi:hypothetical protein
MGFQIVHKNGRSNPRAFCDRCDQVIESSGNVEWEWDCETNDPHRHTFQLLHKACSVRMNQERKAKGLPSTLWMPLDHMLVYLSHNLEIDWKESKKHAAAIAAIF